MCLRPAPASSIKLSYCKAKTVLSIPHLILVNSGSYALFPLVLRKQLTKIHRYCYQEIDLAEEICTGFSLLPLEKERFLLPPYFSFEAEGVWKRSGRGKRS